MRRHTQKRSHRTFLGGRTIRRRTSRHGRGTCPRPLRVLKNAEVCQRWRKAKVLPLDGVSMIDGIFFEALDAIHWTGGAELSFVRGRSGGFNCSANREIVISSICSIRFVLENVHLPFPTHWKRVIYPKSLSPRMASSQQSYTVPIKTLTRRTTVNSHSCPAMSGCFKRITNSRGITINERNKPFLRTWTKRCRRNYGSRSEHKSC
mmetsp:Transcript_35213/g.63373  ORF Transcript_35213/g.63373 Transcript_35213/m.63373 type:complete len:206 (+) Transcript_35213:134-751(+)